MTVDLDDEHAVTPDDDGQGADPDADAAADDAAPAERRRRGRGVAAAAAFVVLPLAGCVMAGVLGYCKAKLVIDRQTRLAAIESVDAAKDSATAMLSYTAADADTRLTAAQDRLTSPLREDYAKLIHDVVIPEAKHRNITSVAQVQAAGAVSASPAETVVVVFINQNVTATDSAPADTASTVRMTMTKSGQRWLVSRFDPI